MGIDKLNQEGISGKEQFKMSENKRENVKKMEVEKVPDYSEVTQQLLKIEQEVMNHQDELSNIRHNIEPTINVTRDSVKQLNEILEGFKSQGIEPNFCSSGKLEPYKIEGDKATNHFNFHDKGYDSYNQVGEARSKMLDLFKSMGIDFGGNLRRLSGFENDKLNNTQFTNNEKGRGAYNLQIKYGNLLEAAGKGIIKEEDIKPILTTEARNKGLIK